MATLILHPTATVSTQHTKYPSSTSYAHQCIDETTADGDSTYIYQSVSSTSNIYKDSVCTFSGKFPSKRCKITSVKVFANARSTNSNLTNRRINVVWSGLGETSSHNIKADLPTSYSTYSLTATSDIVEGFQNLIQSDGTISVDITIRTVGQAKSTKSSNTGQVRVSQYYISIDYEEMKNDFLIKTNGLYVKYDKMYKKINGVWTIQDISNYFSSMLNNSKFNYMYGGNI